MMLGIDTSNYKTSVAVTGQDNDIIFERSEYLEVEKGKRGLRQSEAFFVHSNRLPDLVRQAFECVDPAQIAAIGVSTRPRRVEGSYMPCFLAGANAAKEIGASLRVPVYEFSHQEGHAAAVIEAHGSPGRHDNGRSLLFHLSGGTTEFLLCEPDDTAYSLEIVGGTRDISIGQLIDRTGVAMGCSFPAGMQLDELASSYVPGRDGTDLPGIVPPCRVTDGQFNLSGAETKILRYINENISEHVNEYIDDNIDGAGSDDDFRAALAFELFDSIAALLAGCACDLAGRYGVGRVYMAGGVASSTFIRERIGYHTDKLAKKQSRRAGSRQVDQGSVVPDIRFGEPALSGDNAAGVAFLARRLYSDDPAKHGV